MFGDKWRMPTSHEFQELIDSCTWVWDEDHTGYQVTDVIGDIQNLKAELDKKVDVTTYTEEVAKIYAKIASEDQLLADRLVVLEELKKGLEEGDWSKLAAIADIKQQLEALDIFKKRIEALEAKNIITEDEMTAAIKDAVDKLRTELKNYTDTEIQKLKDNEIKKLQEDLQKLLKTWITHGLW